MADSTLKTRIQDDVKDAMRSKDKDRLGTLRLITAAIKQKEVDERIEMDDAAVIAVLEKMVKQRKDSISQYTQAGRDDLAGKEQVELDLIQTYLPEQMSEAELEAVISKAIADTGAAGMKDMGKLMAAVKPLVAGKAVMGLVSKIVKAKLS
ncbi:MAG: GatB/YqeY domain-containing protein [Gammaproteobacteria bacterium]|nr:GatB/YqeY domain-containing protein [Gammaproteobacteria bacterium]